MSDTGINKPFVMNSLNRNGKVESKLPEPLNFATLKPKNPKEAPSLPQKEDDLSPFPKREVHNDSLKNPHNLDASPLNSSFEGNLSDYQPSVRREDPKSNSFAVNMLRKDALGSNSDIELTLEDWEDDFDKFKDQASLHRSSGTGAEHLRGMQALGNLRESAVRTRTITLKPGYSVNNNGQDDGN